MKDYFKSNINCIYYNKCTRRGIACGSCRHNKNREEDHYIEKQRVRDTIKRAEQKYSKQMKEGKYVQGTEITLLEIKKELGLEE